MLLEGVHPGAAIMCQQVCCPHTLPAGHSGRTEALQAANNAETVLTPLCQGKRWVGKPCFGCTLSWGDMQGGVKWCLSHQAQALLLTNKAEQNIHCASFAMRGNPMCPLPLCIPCETFSRCNCTQIHSAHAYTSCAAGQLACSAECPAVTNAH